MKLIAIILILSCFTWLFFEPNNYNLTNQNGVEDLNSNDITLTLSNGIKLPLSLSKGGIVISPTKLTYNDGTIILSNHGGEAAIIAISTNKKSIYKITLPDGSKIWMNCSSKLSFPSTLPDHNRRNIQLTGEAYFEIVKVHNKAYNIPFTIVTDKQEIEVLGTHFNVSAYPHESSIKTTLIEGSVRITPLFLHQQLAGLDPAMTDPIRIMQSTKKGAQQQSIVLKTNQQAILQNNSISIKAVDAAAVIAWTKKEFTFRNMPMETVMNVVANWYDMDIVYQQKASETVLLGGSIQRSERLQDLLATLEQASNVHFKVQGRQISIVK